MKMGKVWGETKPLLQLPNIEVHEITIHPGSECSLHKHVHKWNAFYVISGYLEIHVEKSNYDLVDVTKLYKWDFTTVPPGEYHKFVCPETAGVTKALEIYYTETLTEDIIRKTVGNSKKL